MGHLCVYIRVLRRYLKTFCVNYLLSEESNYYWPLYFQIWPLPKAMFSFAKIKLRLLHQPEAPERFGHNLYRYWLESGCRKMFYLYIKNR